MIVDAHTHLKGPVHPGDERGGAEALIGALDGAGISRAIVAGLDPEDNAGTLRAAEAYPRRLFPFVVVDPLAPVQSLDGLDISRVCGLGEIYLRCGSSQLPEEHLQATLELAAARAWPVMLHTGEFSYTAPLLMGEMMRQFPNVSFILAHMGSLAFVLDAIELAKTFPNVYLDTSGMTSPQALQRAVAECGLRRILFGSDYPYWHPAVEKARVEAAQLSAEVAVKILGENVLRLLTG